MWKGDYWNLNHGAEVGLYKYNEDLSDNLSDYDHYDAITYEVPMTLSLYNYYAWNDIENVFSWDPSDDQWWITGFSGHRSVGDFLIQPDRDKMILVASVDLSAGGLFCGLADARDMQEPKYVDDYDNYLIFDETSNKVWIVWYEGMHIQEEGK